MSDKTLNFRKTAWGLAPMVLLIACGSEGTSGFVQIPTCNTPGQALSTDRNGQLICKDLPPGVLVLPTCLMDSEALTGDGKAMSCTPRRNDDTNLMAVKTNLNTIENRLNDAGTKIKALQATPGAIAVYVGATQATYSGKIAKAGKDVGIASASSLCSDAFAGSRMCTVNDMYYSFAYGILRSGKTVPKSWLYFPAWNTPIAAAQAPLEGLADNCGQYTTDDATLNWAGIAVEYNATNLASGSLGLRFHGGTAALCDQKLPIACCK